MITKQQYRKLMSEHQATGSVTKSAMKADVSQPTARKYLAAGQTPEQLQAKRHWRTRPDPLAGIWPQAEAMLLAAPGLEARVLFEHLWTHAPWAVGQKHLRTFQRRVKQWRLQHGPDKEVFSSTQGVLTPARASYGESYCIAEWSSGQERSRLNRGQNKGPNI